MIPMKGGHMRTNDSCRRAPTIAKGTARLVLMGLLTVLPLLGGGCVTEPRVVPGNAAHDSEPAPPIMEEVAGALMSFRATHGRLPRTLDALAETELLPQRTYATLPDYAYARRGLGALPDGRRILLVDAYIRSADRAWCIVENPAARDGTAQVELVLVPMDTLRHVAARQRADDSREH